MSSHYLFSDGVGEVVPFNAKYSYPTQASRTWKSVVKVQPKNGSSFTGVGGTLIRFEYTIKVQPYLCYLFTPTRLFRFELPAQGYMNVRNTSLTFDLNLTVNAANANARFQNNVQSVFRRLRILYGSLVLEDIRDYNVLVRMLTEGATNQSNVSIDQSSVFEGIGGDLLTCTNATSSANGGVLALVNARLNAIQSSKPTTTDLDAGPGVATGAGTQGVINDVVVNSPPTAPVRRYSVQLASGLFQQAK